MKPYVSDDWIDHTKTRIGYEIKLATYFLLVHGSPRRVNEYLFEDRGDRSLGRVLERASADILCFVHTHKPFHKVVSAEAEGQQTYWRHAINIGSVGKPEDGAPAPATSS